MAEDYSHRSGGYSRPSDVLPALSGIAAFLSKELGFSQKDYVAGSWKQSLFFGLAWEPGSDSWKPSSLANLFDGLGSPETYVLPSWAWPGRGYVMFPVKILARDCLPLCTIMA